MSVICHHFYNVPIFELAQEKQGKFVLGFIDDATLGAEVKTLD